jgi:uncharacterized membrane protein
MMTHPNEVVWTIVGMALATYVTRAGGLWLMNHIQPSPRVNGWLRQLPGAILVTIVVPAALDGGVVYVIATLVTMLVAIRSNSLLLSLMAGLTIIFLLRTLL